MGQLAERQRRFSSEEYERMVAAGFFRDEWYSEPTSGACARVTLFCSGETIQPLAFADVGVPANEVFGS